MAKKIMVDPPSGWQFGFPKPIPDEATGEFFATWMREQGYPQKLIDDGMLKHCRYWEEEDENQGD